jgi:hypothetical protein
MRMSMTLAGPTRRVIEKNLPCDADAIVLHSGRLAGSIPCRAEAAVG